MRHFDNMFLDFIQNELPLHRGNRLVVNTNTLLL